MILFYTWVARLCRLQSVEYNWREIGSLTGPTLMAFVFLWRNLILPFPVVNNLCSRNLFYSLWQPSVCGSWGPFPRYDFWRVSDLSSSSQVPASCMSKFSWSPSSLVPYYLSFLNWIMVLMYIGAFRSYPIISLNIKPNVLTLELRRELLAVKVKGSLSLDLSSSPYLFILVEDG